MLITVGTVEWPRHRSWLQRRKRRSGGSLEQALVAQLYKVLDKAAGLSQESEQIAPPSMLNALACMSLDHHALFAVP